MSISISNFEMNQEVIFYDACPAETSSQIPSEIQKKAGQLVVGRKIIFRTAWNLLRACTIKGKTELRYDEKKQYITLTVYGESGSYLLEATFCLLKFRY